MPVLTTMAVFGMGAIASTLSLRRKNKGHALRQAKTALTLPEAAETQLVETDTAAAEPATDGTEKLLAQSLPLAVVSTISAVAAFSNPLFILPSAAICGYLTAPLLKAGITKYRKHRHIVDLVDSAVVPILIVVHQLLAASLVLLSISVGRKVLSKTYDRSRESLNSILNTLPKKVWLLVDNVEVEVDYREIKPGDTVVLNNTDLVPVDGAVIQGDALVDQTMLTGEAVPAEKTTGDKVYAGTQVVSGRMHIKVEKSGDDTHAGEVSALILQAADRRTAVQEKGEMVLEKSMPPLLALSGIVAVTAGLSRALGVYLVTPGYTLRVLSPIALLQSLRSSTDAGILVKDGRSLELLNGIDTVVFDKTGTLTDGELSVAQVIPLSDSDRESILSLAASAENTQTHPIARAIVNAAQEEHLSIMPLEETEYTVARGIQANVDGQEVIVGSPGFLTQKGYAVSPAVREQMQALGAQGFVVILVGIDQTAAGIIALDQVVRPEAVEVITSLKQRGMQTVIISGDAHSATQHMADQLGIDRFYAETLPGEKAQLIEQMQTEGRKVCFIGDGINDAAALKQANVSLSIRGSSTIAVDTAQVVLVNANLTLLNKLFDIADNYQSVSTYTKRLSIGLPLAALPVVLVGGGGVILVVLAHNLSTWGGLWRIMRGNKAVRRLSSQ
ncbi:MAG: heavy metal translocating P-type ATPase [Thiolinea sp.]